MGIRRLALLCLFVSLSIISFAQKGTLKGLVTDLKTKEPLVGATIMLEGTTKGIITDFDGNYELTNIDPGTYTVRCSFISYETKLTGNIVIKAGQTTELNVQLGESTVEIGGVQVVAKANRESESMLLVEQKNSVVAVQAIGAEELSRKGVGDAEEALTKVSGISKQEGVKNVFVRGLGDRYNFTTLNGFPIPSEDPEYKNISLDFFGTDIIKNINVNKVFSADNNGDVGGAVINISSKELSGDKELKIDLSSGVNTRTVGSDFLKMDGVDYLGVSKNIQPNNNYKTDYNFGNSLDPTSVNAPVNYSYGLSLGKKYAVGTNANPLSFYVVGSYSTSYSYTNEKLYDTTNDGTLIQDLTGNKSSQNINQLALGNVNFRLNKKHEFNYNFVFIHDNSQSVGRYTGQNPDFVSSLQPDEYEYQGFMSREQSNENLLITNQLLGKFKLSERTKLDAGFAYNLVNGIEPDRRVTELYRRSETEYQFRAGDGAHVRNYSKLAEDDFNWKLELNYALKTKFEGDVSAAHLGYNGRNVTDNFNATEYSYNPLLLTGVQTLDDLSLDSWYNQDNYTTGKFVGAARISEYTVTKMLNSGYASIDYQFNPKFTVNAGVRLDIIDINVDYNVEGGYNGDGTAVLNPTYVLPNFNFKYSLSDKQILRLGLSKTYTLPQSKEISPYQYLGLSFNSQGNEDLKPSDNYNADLKWDYYISPSELLSVTAFYKYIKNPIARAYEASAGSYFTYDNVSDHATASGIELELRKNIINNTSDGKNKLSAGLNASYIYSNMLIDVMGSAQKESQLEGAAPFILNVDLSHKYTNNDFSMTNSLVLNYNSDRIYTIGLAGFEDVMEKGLPTLNFVSIMNLNSHFSLKLKAKNILDPEYKLTRDATVGGQNSILDSYHKGLDLSLGLSYKF